MNENLCGHKFNENVICDRECGHPGNHLYIDDIECGVGRIYEWNDIRQIGISAISEVFQVDYGDGHASRAAAMDLAIASAKENLNNGDVFEIRSKLYPSENIVKSDYGRILSTKRDQETSWGIAWIHMPKQHKGFKYLEFPEEPLFVHDVDRGELNALGGYVLLARIRNEK